MARLARSNSVDAAVADMMVNLPTDGVRYQWLAQSLGGHGKHGDEMA